MNASTSIITVGLYIDGEYRVMSVKNEWPIQCLLPLYRGDSRDCALIFKDGFKAKGNHKDFRIHVDRNPDDSAYISTSKSFSIASNYGISASDTQDYGFVYEINPQPLGIDINQTLGNASRKKYLQEVVVPYEIKREDIKCAYFYKGCWRQCVIQNPYFIPPKTSSLPLAQKVSNELEILFPNKRITVIDLTNNLQLQPQGNRVL